MIETPLIRNFSIIAHIDHGKSTLSDRIIQRCGGLEAREMSEQVLDSMDLERERGITIKAQSVSLRYKAQDGQDYQLNLIDTPGHVDFSYEVSRSLAACEGAILLVDASQGVEAQTVANCFKAIELGLEVIPVLNKVDLPTADPQRVSQEIESIIGVPAQGTLQCSAKTGLGIDALMETILARVPAPSGSQSEPLRALIIDSWFDNYLGVVSLIRVQEGGIEAQDRIQVMSTGREYVVESLGVFTPKRQTKTRLAAGEVGWICCSIKEISGAPVGATLTNAQRPAARPLPGFEKVRPQVYAGLFPMNTEDYGNFRKALEKLSLNDAALTYEPENSSALGLGFRCGFLGLLHMDIVQARLEREYGLDLIATTPTVVYRVTTVQGEILKVETPSKLPAQATVQMIEEPIAECHILAPSTYLGKILQLCSEKRGFQKNLTYHDDQVSLTYHLPMSEVVVDLFDRLKSATRGYASLEYAFHHHQPAEVVRLDLLLNGERVDALSLLVHRSQAEPKGREMVAYLEEVIPRQQFDVAIQAAIGNRILARATLKQYRKDVTAKCYGGDITRKRKLLEKQKAGKKKMKFLGKIEVPKSAFLALLNLPSSKAAG